ncbi:MAG: glycosyl hydrolase family 28-related protein, partial [Rariglobus sp.]
MSSTHSVLLAAPRARWLVAALALVSTASAYAQTPLIFTHTKAALPGDVVVLHGANFVQGTALPEVWLDPITGSSDTPNTETLAPEIISYSEKLIHVRVPASLPKGLYALFVKCNGSTSSHVWLNRAETWQALDLAGTQINPGRAFRLYGWNLDLPGATPQVWFKNTATNVLTAATVTNVDRTNFITLTAPASLTPGQNYQLVVSNGYGGTYGETTGPTLACVATPADALNLGVPWADEFSFAATNVINVKNAPYNAVGDGVADDGAAILAACNAANAAGGGGVYFPAGTYNLGATPLKVKSRVVLRGAGMNLTTLVGQVEPHYVHSTLGTTFYNGAMDLTLNGARMRMQSFSPDGGPVIIVRVRIDNNTGTGLDVRGIKTKLLVKDCELITRSTTGKGVFEANGSVNMLFKNNYMQWSEGRIEAGSGLNFQIDGNDFARTVATGNSSIGYGGWEVSQCSNLALIDNVFSKIGSGPIPQYNDGETILNQGVPRFGAGNPTSATATTLTDTARAWTAGQLTAANAWIVIVSGPGEGQWRKITSHTANTVTIDSPWSITPTTASGYTITWRDEHWLIAGNILQDCPRALWLYSCSMTDAAIVDNQFINCADIYLRADQRLTDAAGGRFTVFRNVLLQNNEILNTNHVYPSQFTMQAVVAFSTETSLGNAFWDVIARQNSLDSLRPSLTTGNNYGVNGEGFFAIGVGPGVVSGKQAVKGVLFDRNETVDLDNAFNT